MPRNSLIAIGLVTALSACTTIEERQVANGNFDYVSNTTSTELKVPEDVDKPELNNEYQLPTLGNEVSRNFVGEKVVIVAPTLVLPLVTGSHIEEGHKEATIWFDQVNDNENLDTTIWNSLVNYLDQQGIAIDSFDKKKQILLTDWMVITNDEDSGWFTWTSTERSVGRRFEFSLDVKSHGRSAALTVELKDYLETVGDTVKAELNAEEVRRNEVDVLNQVIGHYSHQIKIADAKRRQKLKQGVKLDLGFDGNGEPAFIVDAEFEVTWVRLQLVLRKLGFNVKDIDKSNGLFYVKYDGADSGFWGKLWGSSEDLEIGKDEYRLQLGDLGRKTSITMLNEENIPVTAEVLAKLHQPIADTMAQDNLDI